MMPFSVTVRLNRFSTGRHMEIKRQRDKTHARCNKECDPLMPPAAPQDPHRRRTYENEQNSDEKSHWALPFEVYGAVRCIQCLTRVQWFLAHTPPLSRFRSLLFQARRHRTP